MDGPWLSHEIDGPRMRRAPEPATTPIGGTHRRWRRRGPNGAIDGPVCLGEDPGRQDRDRGFSIVEIVATITVMSIIMAPLFSGVIASIRASTFTRNTAQVITTLENAADRVNRSRKLCNYDQMVRAAV